MQWYAGFNGDHLLPAMEAAGWPVEHWVEEYPRWNDQAEAVPNRDGGTPQGRSAVALAAAPVRPDVRRHPAHARG